jgi:hypothetical protein
MKTRLKGSIPWITQFQHADFGGSHQIINNGLCRVDEV